MISKELARKFKKLSDEDKIDLLSDEEYDILTSALYSCLEADLSSRRRPFQKSDLDFVFKKIDEIIAIAEGR